jgi:NMD protein affecting ribosome stability and mRNA decay
MKTHHLPPHGAPQGRRIAGRAQGDQVIDPYQRRRKLAEPTRCPGCGAIYRQGRWLWAELPPVGAEEERCPACRRMQDGYPAGVVTLKGAFVRGHEAEIRSLVLNAEQAEKNARPLNRIIAIEDRGNDGLVITTTDIHLPRRIGEALHRAFSGALAINYDENNYFVRIDWQREA